MFFRYDLVKAVIIMYILCTMSCFCAVLRLMVPPFYQFDPCKLALTAEQAGVYCCNTDLLSDWEDMYGLIRPTAQVSNEDVSYTRP